MLTGVHRVEQIIVGRANAVWSKEDNSCLLLRKKYKMQQQNERNMRGEAKEPKTNMVK